MIADVTHVMTGTAAARVKAIRTAISQQGQGGDRNDRNRRQRPSREERRRNREERRDPRGAGARRGDAQRRRSQTGILDLLPDGYGFMRTSGYTPGPEDIYVSLSQVRKSSLRKGDVVAGKVRKARDNEKYWALLEVETVNGLDPEAAKARPNFDKLTPLFPDERFRLENAPAGRHRADHRHDRADRQGSARHGRLAAEGGQDHDPEADRQRHRGVQPRGAPDRAAGRRASRGGHRLAAHGLGRRGRVLHLRQAHRPARAGHRAGARAREAPGRAGAGRRDHPGLADPAGACLQPGHAHLGQDPVRRHRLGGACTRLAGSSALRATSKRAARSRSSRARWSRRARGWTRASSRSSRARGTWRSAWTASSPRSACSPRSTSMPPAPGRRSCCCRPEELAQVIKLRRVLHALEPGAALELLTDKIRATKSNEQFLKEIAKTGG